MVRMRINPHNEKINPFIGLNGWLEIAGSSNGRTSDFDSENGGSIPSPVAIIIN